MLEKLYADVRERCRCAFPDVADIRIARAPGRVNIIGEHTDYNGLPVLPTAIDREIAIAFTPSGSQEIALANFNPKFEEKRFSLSAQIEPFSAGDWGNYAKAAAQALWGWAEEKSPGSLPLKGFMGCAGGTIPPGSGLSSSSAMVVAAAFALIAVNDLPVERAELASLLARGERYVGTEGGGMDQAASILSLPGNVLKIDFRPLRTRAVPLPDECIFIIANSMVVADKAGSARTAYNTRVAECRLGLEMLKTISRGSFPAVNYAVLLGDVMSSVPEWRSAIEDLPKGGLSVARISDFCGVDESALRERCLRLRDGSMLDEPAAGFQVRKRCKHVLTEAERVDLAAAAMREGRLDDLGQHMNDSHESCARDYEVSCPELDALVDILRRSGALGARLTGAGFGGCAVAAVRRGAADELLKGVVRSYYRSYLISRGLNPAVDTSSAVFKCVTSAGAGIL